jgi:cytochrome c-type biogenesis protein CcmH/NrfG
VTSIDERRRACDLADAYLDRGRPREALAAVADVLREHPDDAEAWLVVTRAHLSLGESAEALDAAERAVRLRPHSDVALRFLALARLRGHDPRGAEAAAREACVVAPHDPWNHAALSLTLLGRDRRAAERAAATAVELAPLDADLHVVHARPAISGRRFRLGRERLQKALDLDPTNAQALQLLASLDSVSLRPARLARGLGVQLGQVREAPSDREAVATLEIMTHDVHARIAAVVALGSFLAFRVAASEAPAEPGAAVRLIALASAVLALALTWRTYAAADPGARRVLADLLRVPRVAWATSLLGVALLAQLVIAVAPSLQWPLAVAVLACFVSWLAMRVERRQMLRRNGRPVPPGSSPRVLLTLGIVCAAVTALFLLASASAAASGGAQSPLGFLVVAAVFGACTLGLGLRWWRRRR